jgi:transposase
MTNGSKGTRRVTVGVDLGDTYSYLCFLDTDGGDVVEESRLRTTPETLEQRFSGCERMRIAIETGTHSPWVSRLLEECGHEVLVANARKVRLIYGDKHKTDKLDAENLARLARVDPRLLCPLKHRGKSFQEHLAIVRSREVLVGSRTQLINHGYGERSNPSGLEQAQVLSQELPQEGARSAARGACAGSRTFARNHRGAKCPHPRLRPQARRDSQRALP